jgi:hypothetical protein
MRSDDASIFKPSGNAWLPGKCDQMMRAFSSQAVTLGCPENAIRWCEHFQAKRQGLAARKMRSDDASIFKPSGKAWLFGRCDQKKKLAPLGRGLAKLGGADQQPIRLFQRCH